MRQPPADYHYIAQGDYLVLRRGQTPVGPPLASVGIAYSFDGANYTLHKHGSPAVVARWLQEAKAQMSQSPAGARLAGEFHFIQGHFEARLLNKAIAGSHAALAELVGSPSAMAELDRAEEEPMRAIPAA